MQSAVEIKSDLELKISISVPANEFKDAFGKRIQEVAKTAHVTGFRPGKVPLAYVKKFYGAGIETEVVDEIVRKSFDKVCKERDLTVAGIEKLDVTQKKLGKDLEFYLDVELFPEIKFDDKDFTDIKLDKYTVDITKKDISDSIEKLRKSHATWETASASSKAKLGDKVVIDFKGIESENGNEIESGSAEDFELELGSNHLIPGFEDGIVGHKVSDDVFTLDLTFPEDYHVKEHAGKAVKFDVTLKEIKHSKLPEIDQEFCAKFGVFPDNADEDQEQDQEQDSGADEHVHGENCNHDDHDHEHGDANKQKELSPEELKQLKEKFEEKVVESLNLEAKKLASNKYKSALYDSIREHKKISVPKFLVEEEINKLVQHKQDMYRQYTGNKDAGLELDRETFRDEAVKNTHLMLVVRGYISQYQLKVNQEQLKAKLGEQWGDENVSEDLLNWYISDENRLRQIESQVLEDLVVQSLEQRITLNDTKVTFKDLVEDKS